MNEPDSYADEEALRLKEKHTGEVVVVSIGPERVKQTIQEALAKGAHRGMHIAEDRAHTLDPLGATKPLAISIEREKPDLVLPGLPSDNQGFSLTGVFLAERLGLPQATVIMQIDVESDRLRVKREREGRWSQRLKLLLPAVLTIQSDFDDHPSRCREKNRQHHQRAWAQESLVRDNGRRARLSNTFVDRIGRRSKWTGLA